MDGAFPSQNGQSFEGGMADAQGDGAFGRGRGFKGTAENSKTKLCNRWLQGDCRFGDRCNFAHGEQEMRELPPRDVNGPPVASGSPGGRSGYGGRGGGRGPSFGYGGRGPAGPPGAYGPQGGRGRGYDEYYQPGFQQGGFHQGPYQAGYGMEHMPQGGGYGQVMGVDPAGRMGQNQPFNTPIPGPNSWVGYRSGEGEVYFHNHRTNATQWEAPTDWPNPPK